MIHRLSRYGPEFQCDAFAMVPGEGWSGADVSRLGGPKVAND